MKKYLLSIAVLMAGAISFTSCSDDDDNNSVICPVSVTDGIYVVNAGNASSVIDGSLSTLSYNGSLSVQNGAFKAKNGRSLGGTPNDALVLGNKLYIVVTDENAIEVVDKKTLTSVAQIKTTTLLDATKGAQPRHLATDGENVYVSTYGGYVAQIDTTTFTAKKTFQVGSYPEGMAYDNGWLYVANSGYGVAANASISKVDVAAGVVTNITDSLITNPQSFTIIDGSVYFLDYGQYLSVAPWTQYGAGVRSLSSDGKVKRVFDATLMAGLDAYGSDADAIYFINSPYTTAGTAPVYGKYNVQTQQVDTLKKVSVVSPSALAVDPSTGMLFIGSLRMGEYGYPDYNGNGYIGLFSAEGDSLGEANVGVDPIAVVFDDRYIFK